LPVRSTVLALVLAAMPIGLAGPAAAASVTCGSTITSDLVLTRDLQCRGDGLLVGADDLTIDLNGHRISGSGSGTAIRTDTPAGPFGSVRVRNGTIRDFATGISLALWHGTGAHVSAVTFRGNETGINGYGSYGGIEVAGSTFVDNSGFGIQGSANRVTIDRSRFQGNDVGVFTTWSGSQTVTGSTFNSNRVGLNASQNGIGLTGSTFRNNGTGVLAYLSGVAASSNTFTGGGIGLDITEELFKVSVAGNSFTGAGVGLKLTGTLTDSPVAEVTSNTFTRNGSSGLLVSVSDPDVARLEVTGNTFSRNGFDPGSEEQTAGAYANTGTFTGNTAVGNAGYGIEGRGVVDGGSNHARRNGSSPQCLGVVCTS
jgi:hypothetical protein